MQYMSDEPRGRFLVTIHTHADVETGGLCNAESADSSSALYNTVEEVLHYNLGPEVLESLIARSTLKGLLLLACGPAVGPQHIDSVLALLKSSVLLYYLFTLLIPIHCLGGFLISL